LIPVKRLLTRVWDLYQTPHGKKLFRYTMVSVISTVISLALLLLVYGVLRLWSEVPSTVFANLVAAVPSYYLNRTWAWGKTGKSHLVKEVLPFWVLAIGGTAFSVVGAAVARGLGNHFHFDHLDRTALVLAANVLSFAVFWVVKLLIFNRIFHLGSPLEDDPVEA
jgi:putative flippase GtrA